MVTRTPELRNNAEWLRNIQNPSPFGIVVLGWLQGNLNTLESRWYSLRNPIRGHAVHRKSLAVLFFCLLSFFACTTTGARPANVAGKAAPAKDAPPLGDYVCSMVVMGWNGTWTSEDKGLLTLISADTYKYRNGDDRGTYTFEASTKKMKFKTGFFRDATGTFIPRDKVWQIDVDFATKSPMTWNCALPKYLQDKK